jgi:voltage-gated potassium channel
MPSRERLHAVFEARENAGPAARGVRAVIVTLIVLSTVGVVADSVPGLAASWRALFRTIDVVAGVAFTIEYALRLYACTADPAYAHPVTGRIRYALRPVMLLDLLAVLPLFLGLLATEMRIVRVLRLLRVLRAAKLGRYSSALGVMGRVVRARSADLVATVSLVVALLVLASSAMWMAERDAQPDKFGSIPAAMWWAAITITTVGYGDVYPVTAVGRVLGACVAVFGIALFALPTSIFAAEFLEQFRHRRETPARCPHCGEPLDAAPQRPDEGEGVT